MWALAEARGHLRRGAQQQRGDRHRAEGGGENQPAELGRQQIDLLRLGDQGKTELAALGQGQAAAPGRLVVAAAQAHQQRHQAALDQQQGQGHGEDQQAVGGEQADVDQHADADEEQAEEDVAERTDVGLDLVAIVALAEQHAGQEGAECHRQAEQVGQPGGEQHDDQRQQHEQLGGVGLRHLVEQSRQQPAAGHQQAGEQQRGLAQGDRQRPVPGLLGAAGDHRNHGQQQHGDQILEQQHADGVLAV
ncbi:hypothetical protein D3C75_679620 [compost metagenome]